jgi:hypothetical protein
LAQDLQVVVGKQKQYQPVEKLQLVVKLLLQVVPRHNK